MKRFHFFTLIILTLFCVACIPEPKPPKITASVIESTYEKFRADQKHFVSDAGKMAYTDVGHGDVLVLLHGVPTSSWLYRNVMPGLAKSHRVIAPDFIGFGSSAKPKNDLAGYSTASRAKRIKALLSHLGVERYSIMTHDMGGLVTWELMKDDSASIDHLIVQNTIVHTNGFHPPEMKRGFLTEQLMKAYSSRWTSDAIWMMTARNLGLKSSYKLTPEECEGYVTPLREGADKALYSFFTSLDKAMLSKLDANKEVFKNFKGSTLILWGEIDETLTTAQIPFLKEHLRVAPENVHIYKDNGHFLAEEIPGEVVKQVNAFLAAE